MKNSLTSLWQEVTAGKLARHTPVLLLAVLVLAIPLTVYIAGKQQQIQQHAAGTFSCTLYPDAVTFDPNNQTMIDGGCNGSNYCVRYNVQYSGSPAQPVSQFWFFGDGTTGTNHYSTTSITHHGYPFPASGSKQYSVRMSATDKNGVVGQDCTKTITVLPNSGGTGSAPNNISFSINPTSVNIDKIDTQPQISLNNLTNTSNSSVKTGYRVFIYKKTGDTDTGPSSGQGATQVYNASNVPAGIITYLDASPNFNRQYFTTPTQTGTYYIMVNAYNGNLVCDWNRQVYDLSQDQNPPHSIGTCSTTGKVTFTVNDTSGGTILDGLYINSPLKLSANIADPSNPPAGFPVNVSLTDAKAPAGFRLYIYKKVNKEPVSGQASVAGIYDPKSMQDDTFYSIESTSPSQKTSYVVPAPIQDGTYYLVANAYSTNPNYTCDWSGTLYGPNGIKSQCNNQSRVTMIVGTLPTVSDVSVDSVTPDNTAPNPGDTVNVAVSGKAARMWVYLFKSSTGGAPDPSGITTNPGKYPTIQSYDPGNVANDTFYKVGTFTGGSGTVPVTMPSDAGTYYFAANAHSDGSTTSPPWAKADHVCAWSGNVFQYDYSSGSPTNVIWAGSTCSNTIGGPVTIGGGNPPSGNPTGGNPPGGNPPGGGPGGILCQILPFLCPTPTPTPTTVLTPTIGPTSSTSVTPTNTGTPAPTPATPLQFMVLLHGIGAAGDNANPQGSSLSNKSPNHPNRTLTVTLFDTNNQQVAQTTGTISYNSADGDFTGTAGFGTNVPSGSYIVKVKTDQYLTRRIDGIQTVTANQSNNMPSATLVAGDTNNDDTLNALDYNMILDCFSDTLPAPACSDSQKQQMADLNDDGVVNQTDYNLFVRELSVKNGD